MVPLISVRGDTLKSWGIELKTVTEYWPQENGQVEHFNEVLEKHVQTSRVERKDWRQSITTMLRNYRTTPHKTKRKQKTILQAKDLLAAW